MCDEQDPGGRSYGLVFPDDSDETDCYSSACEDDHVSEDEGCSDTQLEPDESTPARSVCEESDDADGPYGLCRASFEEAEKSPEHDESISPSLVEPVMPQEPVESVDSDFELTNGFRGFDVAECRDNRALQLFKQFRDSVCLCEFIKEEDVQGVAIINPTCGIREQSRLSEKAVRNEASSTRPVRLAKVIAKAVIGTSVNEQDADDSKGDLDIPYDHREADGLPRIQGLWSCDQCRFQTNDKRIYNKHQWSHKLNEERFKCSICGLKFAKPSVLGHHVLKEHENPSRMTRLRQGQRSNHVPENKCSLCGLVFETGPNLYSHVKQQHCGPEKRYYHCSKCNHLSDDKNRHRYHVRKHTEDVSELKKCHHCDYSTRNVGSYRQHVMRHTGEKPYACPHCPYRARQHPHLKQHLLFHFNLKPFKCGLCDFKTRQKSHLTKHVLWVHSDNKPFKCSLCDFTAKSKKTRDTHVLSQHTEDQPYACKLCPFKTAHVSLLNSHKKGHDSVLDFPCPECSWSAGTSLSLDHHVSSFHPNSKLLHRTQVSPMRLHHAGNLLDSKPREN